MKRLALFTVMLLTPLLLFSDSDEARDGIDALIGTVDLSEWDEWLCETDSYDGMLPSEWLRTLSGLNGLPAETVTLGAIGEKLLPTAKSAAGKMALLMGLAVLGAAVQGVSTASSIGEAARTAFRITASGIVLVLVLREIRTATDAIASIERSAEVIMPVLTGFLMLGGFENTAGLLPISQALLSDVVLRVIGDVAVPASVLGGVLLTLDTDGTGRLCAIGRLLQRAGKWTLGAVCSLFMLITSIRSVAAVSADGLLLKTTRLAAGSIPAVGQLLSESVDTALQCLKLVKNALGLTGCIVILSVAARPIVSVAVCRAAVRASSLLSEPLAGKPYADLLRGMGDTLQLLLLSELASAAMLLFLIAPALLPS